MSHESFETEEPPAAGAPAWMTTFGDRVIFSAYAGTEVKVGGEEFMILGEDDILGVVEL